MAEQAGIASEQGWMPCENELKYCGLTARHSHEYYPLYPHVSLFNVFIAQQGFAGAVQYYFPVFEHVGPVGYAEGLLDVLFYNKHGDTFLSYSFYNVKYLPDKYWRQSERRLIKHKQFGHSHQAPAYSDHLLFPAA